jgi:flagellar assembly factor FliW
MRIQTRRFGEVEIDPETIWHFPRGLLGLEHRERWCLLHHEEVEHLDWLQAIDDPEVALLLVNPDELFSDYDVDVNERDIAPLELSEVLAHESTPPVVMRVVIRPREESETFIINVAAPILFNLANRRGMQLALDAHRLPPKYRGPVALSTGTEALATV